MTRYPPIVPPGRPRRCRDRAAASRHGRAALALALAVLGLGCDPRPPAPASSPLGVSTIASPSPAAPSTAGLLVADGGPIRVTDAHGQLVEFAGPTVPVERLSAAGETVVAVTADGVLIRSGPGDGPGQWREIRAAIGPVGRIRLPAVGPSGTELAVATGDLQATSFDLVIVDLAADTARTLHIDRGLDGTPAWLGSRRIAIDATRPDGAATLVLIDAASGALSVPAITATVVSSTPDGGMLVVDDPSTGDVLIGKTDGTGAGWAPSEPSRIAGSDAAGVENLALSPDGTRLAIVRRTGDQTATIVLLASDERGWAAIGSLEIRGDHAVSIAWLR
jgi:hypothetical protein